MDTEPAQLTVREPEYDPSRPIRKSRERRDTGRFQDRNTNNLKKDNKKLKSNMDNTSVNVNVARTRTASTTTNEILQNDVSELDMKSQISTDDHDENLNKSGSRSEDLHSEDEEDDEDDDLDQELEEHEDYVKYSRMIDPEEMSSGVSRAFLAMDGNNALECVWQEVDLNEITLTNDKYKSITRHFEELCDLEHQNLVDLRRFWIDYQYVEHHDLEKDVWYDVESELTKYQIQEEDIETLIELLETRTKFPYLLDQSEDGSELGNEKSKIYDTSQTPLSKLAEPNREKIKFRLVFVTEYIQAGTIDTHFREKDDTTNNPSTETITRWLIQILSALDYLHEKDPALVHANLSCKAVFRHHNGNFKLGGYWYDTIVRCVLGKDEKSPSAYYDKPSKEIKKNKISEPSDQCHLSTASSGIEEKEPKISRQVETGTTTTELTKASKAASSTDTCIPQPPISSDIFAFGVIAILICKPSIVKNILKKYEKSSKRSKIYVDPIAEALSKAEKRDKYIEILKQEKSTKLLGNLIELCCGKERAHSISCKSLLKNEALIDVPTLKLISCRRLIENESDQIYTNVEDEGNTPIISWISLRSGKEKYLTTRSLKELLQKQNSSNGETRKVALNLQSFYEDVRNGVYAVNMNFEKPPEKDNETGTIVTDRNENSQTTHLHETESGVTSGLRSQMVNSVDVIQPQLIENFNMNTSTTINNTVFHQASVETIRLNTAATLQMSSTVNQPTTMTPVQEQHLNPNILPSTNVFIQNSEHSNPEILKDCEVRVEQANFNEVKNTIRSDSSCDENNNIQPSSISPLDDISAVTKYTIDFNIIVYLKFSSGKTNELKTRAPLNEFNILVDDLIRENYIRAEDRGMLDSTFASIRRRVSEKLSFKLNTDFEARGNILYRSEYEGLVKGLQK